MEIKISFFFVHSTNDLRYCVYIKQHAFIYSDLIVMVRLTNVTKKENKDAFLCFYTRCHFLIISFCSNTMFVIRQYYMNVSFV